MLKFLTTSVVCPKPVFIWLTVFGQLLLKSCCDSLESKDSIESPIHQNLFSEIQMRIAPLFLEFSGLHYCLFVKVPCGLLRKPQEICFAHFQFVVAFVFQRQLCQNITGVSLCQQLFSFSSKYFLKISHRSKSLFSRWSFIIAPYFLFVNAIF